MAEMIGQNAYMAQLRKRVNEYEKYALRQNGLRSDYYDRNALYYGMGMNKKEKIKAKKRGRTQDMWRIRDASGT
jgi:hypothetical protein